MKTYLAHSISLAMVPVMQGNAPLEIFDWHFQVVNMEEAFNLIRDADAAATFQNVTVLPMMDNILADLALDYNVSLPAPQSNKHIRLDSGDTLLVVRYSGRTLEQTDRKLPAGSRITFYKMEMRVAPPVPSAWTEMYNVHSKQELTQ